MIKRNEEKLGQLIGIQVDDNISAGTESFVALEEKASKQLPSKAVKIIGKESTKVSDVELSTGLDGESI